MTTPSQSAEDKARYSILNKENLDFLMNRYNKVNRWVIADMIRRSAYHSPRQNRPSFSAPKRMTYRELEAASNQRRQCAFKAWG